MNRFNVKPAWIGLSVITLAMMMAFSCEEGSSVSEQRAVEKQQRQYEIAQPVPGYDWSLEREIMRKLYDARNAEVTTYTVWRGEMSTIEGHCPSIGYPLPYDTSLTNPLQMVGPVGDRVVIEQAEPNGIFASKNSTATWVRCVVNDKQSPVLIEANVTTYPFFVEVDLERGLVIMPSDAVPSFDIEAEER